MTTLKNEGSAMPANTLHDQGIPNTMAGMLFSPQADMSRIPIVALALMLVILGVLAILVTRLL